MKPVAELDFLIQEANHLPTFASRHQTVALSLEKAVKHLDALPGRPQTIQSGLTFQKPACPAVVTIIPAFERQPPGGVGVTNHFFRDLRKATPSNLLPRPVPTALWLAISEVMRGRPNLVTMNLVLPLEVTAMCSPSGNASMRLASE